LKNSPYHWLILFVALLLLGSEVVLEKASIHRNGTNRYLQDFQLKLSEKEQYLGRELTKAGDKLSAQVPASQLVSILNPFAGRLSRNGMVILVYQADTIRYWSDNSLNFPDEFHSSPFKRKLVMLGSAWYTTQVRQSGNWTLVGLIRIRYEYPYKNKFLHNNFATGFRLPEEVLVSPEKMKQYRHYIVSGYEGSPLFVLNYKDDLRFDEWRINYPVIFFLLALFCLLIWIRLRMRSISGVKARMIFLALFAVGFVLIRALMIHFHWPASLYALDIFDPAHYAASRVLPSLGDLLFNALGAYVLVYVFTRDQFILLQDRWRSGFKGVLLRTLTLLFLFILFILIERLFASLVLDSDISFEARSVLELSVYSFAGLLSIGFLFAAFSLIADKFLWMSHEQGKYSTFYLPLLISLLLCILYFLYTGDIRHSPVLLFSAVLFAVLFHVRNERRLHFNYTVFVSLVFLFSIFSVYLVDRVNELKERERGKVLAMNLSTEHDPIAELMLDGMAGRIRNDRVLKDRLFAEPFSIDPVYEYVRNKYFPGYWGKYDLQVNICDNKDSILVQPDNKNNHCLTFFDELVKNNGLALADSGFYYLDNRNGRISYFGRFEFSNASHRLMLNLNVDSKPVSNELGYPELLLDQKMLQSSVLRGFSHAKYYEDRLTTQAGDYQYSRSGAEFAGEAEFTEITSGGYRHLVYHPDALNKVVLSKPLITSYDLVIAFSYIFVFFFILTTFMLLLSQPKVILSGFSVSFRNRIQYSMIGLLMLSLLMVGGGSVYFSIRQYKDKHKEILSEKMQSVYVELSQRLQHETRLSQGWSGIGNESLEELLRKFSNVFYSDINIYDLNGQLLATSRPEVFLNQLTGTRMNRQAFYEMKSLQKAEFIHPEQIGNLTYLSAYVPFMNAQGKVLAYLNLPYFTRQNVLAGEISNLVVAFVNVYLILVLLSISLAVIISRRITHPLRLIQEKIGRVKLGRSYEKIHYRAKDELAGLVEEYNRMLEELEISAEKLARSERETAWREMARQIAHEIKNPLTPMKLSVQHLLRAWDDKAPHFDELLRKLTRTLTEQIDTLSHIASEFSSFATLPKGTMERINLVEIARHALSLFEQSDNLSITLNTSGLSEAWVNSDREQLGRALINLVKNGMQAIPEGKPGIIRIGLIARGNGYVLSVEDNGTGIPDELRDKMFQPNFTTKSAGMGLGLAIVKRIAESAGGRIWFETHTGLGTSFFIEIPAA
jgi:signal transduction histidine kinase